MSPMARSRRGFGGRGCAARGLNMQARTPHRVHTVKTCSAMLIGMGCALAVLSAAGCNESSIAFDESRGLYGSPGTVGPASARAGEGGAPVFATAGVSRVLSAEDLACLPEYARLDAGMNIASAQPMLATDQWPQTPAPSLYDRRYLSLPSNPQNVMYIDPSAPRDPYWRYRYWR